MVIKKKPKQRQTKADYLIGKGADDTGKKRRPRKKGRVPVNLRIPAHLLVRIDAALKLKAIPIPRHQWLLEAIADRMEAEGL